jgi:hypothetical protein
VLGSALVSADVWTDNGYALEESLFHRYYTKGDEIVIVPYEDPNFLNWNWVHERASADKVRLLSYWDFIPAQIPVSIYPDGNPVTWEGSCYHSITATLVANETGGTLTVKTSGRKNDICSEFYDFGDRESAYLLELIVTNTHHIKFSTWKPYEYNDLVANGMKAFLFPGNPPEILASVLLTLSLFEPSQKMVEENVQFIGEKMQWLMQPRTAGVVNIDKSEVKSGDYLAILRLDGIDPLIMWGTGGHTGHTAIALWFGEDLYVCESTDTLQLNSSFAYWPPPYGIIRTPWDQWIQQANDAQYLVSLLRLAPEYLAQFDADAAATWFKTVEGMPYGWHNFVYTFIDTMYDNLPRPASPDLMEQVFGIYEPRVPVEDKMSVNSMIVQGLNHRLGTNCVTLQCIYDTIDPQGIPLFEVASQPEQDVWMYPGNGCPYDECYSMVCDVFVMSMYRNAGLQLPSFQSTEQTPKDTYQMAIYDAHWRRPKVCVDADPDLPYCQLMGDYKLVLDGFNGLALYENMNHFCPAYAPVYMRTPTTC